MKSYQFAPLALLSLLALSLVAEAHPGGGMKRGFGGPGAGFPGKMLERMSEHLDLDETQRQSVENILEASKPEFEALRDRFKANREALQALDPAGASYSVNLEAAAAENGRLATEATLLRSRVRTEINAVLTEEQREKLARSKARFRDAFKRRGESS